MPKIIPTRTPMAEQPPAERIHNFTEVPFGYSVAEAMAEAQRCLLCKRPTCIDGCPVHINIVDFMELAAKGDFRAAINLIKESDALPAITGRVCPQETQCEQVCVMARKGHDVTIFEALHEPGGVLVYGIPEFRLPKEIVRKEIYNLERMGVSTFGNR